ncbi:MAG: DUF4129 domain-containing protein [Chloroflexota bacterium]
MNTWLQEGSPSPAVRERGLGGEGTFPALAADPPPSSATPAQLAALQQILRRPEFQAAENRSLLDRLLDPIRLWLRQLGQRILALLARVIGPLVANGGGAVILWAVVGVSLVVVLGAAFLLRRLMRGAVAEDATLGGFLGAVRSPRAAEELARAGEAAQVGDARRALHHHYRAVLLRLDEREHLSLDSALTNRELLPRLAAAPALAEPFGALVARFDRLWYGQTDCSAEEYAGFAALADRVWQAAETVPPLQQTRRGPPSPSGPSLAASFPRGGR